MLRADKADFKVHELPLARIKKIMKIEDEIKVGVEHTRLFSPVDVCSSKNSVCSHHLACLYLGRLISGGTTGGNGRTSLCEYKESVQGLIVFVGIMCLRLYVRWFDFSRR